MKKIILILTIITTLLINSLGFAASDYEFNSKAIRLPQAVDHSSSKYLPKVGDQGYINNSIGWSLGYYLRTYQQAKDLGWEIKDKNGNDRKDRVFSPSFIYNQINEGKNEGSNFKDAIDILKYQGVVTLDEFDENNDYRKKPDAKTVTKAYPHRIMDSSSIDIQNSTIETTIQRVKEALVLEELPVLGTYAGPNWKYPYLFNGRSFITSDEFLGKEGNHAVVIVGYDDGIITPEGRGAFKIVNSWGSEWGDDGYAYLTYKAFEKHGYYLGFFVDLKNEEKPVEVVKDINVAMLSPRQVKYSWKPTQYAIGYRIYDEYNNIIDEIYGSTEYVEILNNAQVKTRYIQAFNAVFESELVKFTVNPQEYDSTNKVIFDRESSRKLNTVNSQPFNKEWTVSFNRDILYGEYLKKNIFVVDKDNYPQEISISPTSDKKKLKIIAPKNGYESGKVYTIVLKDVLDTNGNVLKENTIMDFSVK